MAVTAKNLGAAQQGRRPLNVVVFPKGDGGGNHVTSTFDDGAPAWTTRGAKVTFRSYSSMLIRGMGKKSKSQTWLGTAGHHRESRQRQPAPWRSFRCQASSQWHRRS